jgi:hypothetical protein
VLLEERQKTLRDGSSVMYDSTAWNLSMMYGLAALEVPEHMTKNLIDMKKGANIGTINEIDNAIAYIVDGASDASVGFAARLMEQNIQIRILDKQGLFNKSSFNRGSVVVYLYDNTLDRPALHALIKKAAEDTGTDVTAIKQGLGEGDLPDIGGEHFKLLAKPQIALLSQNGINVEDLGSIWHMIDTQLGIRHSHLSQELLNDMDLRQYNVIVVPSRYYGTLSKANISMLDNWVSNGGTLILNGNSASQLANEENFSQVNMLGTTFEKSAEYNIALYREWLSQQKTISNNTMVNNHTVATQLWFP